MAEISSSTATFAGEEGFTRNNKKQRTHEYSNTILLKFINTKDDEKTFFRVKPTVTFRKIFQSYCELYNLQEGTLNFLKDGHKILPNLTPQDIHFPDGGEIDVMSYVGGGGGCTRL